MSKVLGFQIVEARTNDPPEGMASYEIYPLVDCLRWLELNDRTRYHLLPVFEGDIEDPTFMCAY